MRFVLWTLITLATSGCSVLAATETLPKRADGSSACISTAWPAADTALTVASAVIATALVSDLSSGEADSTSLGLSVGIAAVPVGLAASAIYGYAKASRCWNTRTTGTYRHHTRR